MTRRLAALALLAAGALHAGCTPRAGPAPGARPDVLVECRVTPRPPRVGPATVEVDLADGSGRPIAGASVGVEGNMNHAGMVPSIASTEEVEPGRHRGTLELTMGGDWVLLLDIRLADGTRLERRVDLPAVARR